MAWRNVIVIASASALAAGLFDLLSPNDAPSPAHSPPLPLTAAPRILRDRPVALANLGYLGHMWELYAMWSWIAAYTSSSAVAFVAIAAGGPGSLVAGKLADRIGRTTVTIARIAVSGAWALAIGFFFGA